MTADRKSTLRPEPLAVILWPEIDTWRKNPSGSEDDADRYPGRQDGHWPPRRERRGDDNRPEESDQEVEDRRDAVRNRPPVGDGGRNRTAVVRPNGP